MDKKNYKKKGKKLFVEKVKLKRKITNLLKHIIPRSFWLLSLSLSQLLLLSPQLLLWLPLLFLLSLFVATAIIVVVVIFEKNKIYKFDLKDKIKNYKIFDKRAKKKKTKKSKEEWLD